MTDHWGWFVTGALRPDVLLEGPYESYEACSLRCILKVRSNVAALSLVQGRLPGNYVPRRVKYELRALHYIVPPVPSPVERPARPARRTRAPKLPTTELPEVVYTYTYSDLVTLCHGLGLQVPHNKLDRADFILYIREQLDALACKGGAT